MSTDNLQQSASALDAYLSRINKNLLDSTVNKTDGKKIDGSKILKGKVVKITEKDVWVCVGSKEEGRISKTEFTSQGQQLVVNIGDIVEVCQTQSADGNSTYFSRTRALQEMAWEKLDAAYHAKKVLDGLVIGMSSGPNAGLTVEILDAPTFLPEKQSETTRANLKTMIGAKIKVKIIKLDRKRASITVSQKQIETDENTESQIDNIISTTVTEVYADKAILTSNGQQFTLLSRDYLWEDTPSLVDKIHVGQELRVKVLSSKGGSTFVSHKHLFVDPWMESIKQAGLSVGMSIEAIVKNVAENTVFFSLSSLPPVDAIMNATNSALQVGDKSIVVIKEIDKKHSSVIVEIS